ncbi:MAG: hypothetical protein ACREBD_18320 [Blastocatellia bacterium]
MRNVYQLPDNFILPTSEEIQRFFGRAVKHALLIHRKLGNPVAVRRDGKVVWVPSEEIQVDENDPEIDYEYALKSFALVHGTSFLEKVKQ